MIASSVPAVMVAVRQMVIAALTGQVDAVSGAPVNVVLGEVGTFLGPEYVVLLGVSGGSQTWATVGKSRRNETYQIHGLVRAYVGSDDQAYCLQRAYDLYALIEVALDADPFVGGVVNGSVQSEPTDLRMGVTEKGGVAAELDFVLPVTTQLIATP